MSPQKIISPVILVIDLTIVKKKVVYQNIKGIIPLFLSFFFLNLDMFVIRISTVPALKSSTENPSYLAVCRVKQI